MRMKFALPMALALLFGLSGCGGKSPSEPRLDPVAAQQEVDQGNADLANGDYPSANQHFKRALQLDPNNPDANLGAAITEIYLAQNNPDVAGLIPFFEIPLARKSPDPRRELQSLRVARGLRLMGGSTSARFDPVSSGRATFRMMAKAVDDPPAISDVQRVIRDVVMPVLNYAEARLNIIEQHPGFSLRLPPAVTGEPDTIEIDLGDVLILDSVLNGIQGWLGLLVAYNFDMPYEHVNAESLLAPGTQWATLHPGGGLQLANARIDFLTVKTRMDAAVASIRAEADDQSDDLIPVDVVDSIEFGEMLDGITLVYNTLNEPVVFETTDHSGAPFSFALHLGRFFTPAIGDLKTKFPSHDFNQFGDPYLIDPLTLPDPTINNIFPDMTNARWQLLVGPVGPQVAAR